MEQRKYLISDPFMFFWAETYKAKFFFRNKKAPSIVKTSGKKGGKKNQQEGPLTYLNQSGKLVDMKWISLYT